MEEPELESNIGVDESQTNSISFEEDPSSNTLRSNLAEDGNEADEECSEFGSKIDLPNDLVKLRSKKCVKKTCSSLGKENRPSQKTTCDLDKSIKRNVVQVHRVSVVDCGTQVCIIIKFSLIYHCNTVLKFRNNKQ